MKREAIFSAILHLAVLLLFSFGINNPFKKTVLDQPMVLIDFVQISDQTAAPKLAPETTKKEEPLPEPKPEEAPPPVEPPANEPEPAETKSTPENNEPPAKVEKKEEPIPEPVKPKKDPIPPKPEKKKEEPKKPEKPEKKDKKSDSKKAEINLDKKNKNSKKSDKKPDKKKKSASINDLFKEVEDSDTKTDSKDGAKVSAVSEVATASEIDAIRQTIYKCWSVPIGARGAKGLVVEMDIDVAPDGTVSSAEIVDKGRMSQDQYFQSAAESARRAVLDPRCNPLPIPKDKYEKWKSFTMTFNPKDMF